jgi:hypothetical protein
MLGPTPTRWLTEEDEEEEDDEEEEEEEEEIEPREEHTGVSAKLVLLICAYPCTKLFKRCMLP